MKKSLRGCHCKTVQNLKCHSTSKSSVNPTENRLTWKIFAFASLVVVALMTFSGVGVANHKSPVGITSEAPFTVNNAAGKPIFLIKADSNGAPSLSLIDPTTGKAMQIDTSVLSLSLVDAKTGHKILINTGSAGSSLEFIYPKSDQDPSFGGVSASLAETGNQSRLGLSSDKAGASVNIVTDPRVGGTISLTYPSGSLANSLYPGSLIMDDSKTEPRLQLEAGSSLGGVDVYGPNAGDSGAYLLNGTHGPRLQLTNSNNQTIAHLP